MTREQAQRLIDSYCVDIPADEPAAVRRLMDHDLSEFDLMGTATAEGHDQQDVLDALIYAEGVASK